jgi:2-oxoglutarate dehydrogenase E2 component (dihydrolipoamide succinyltransferase)
VAVGATIGALEEGGEKSNKQAKKVPKADGTDKDGEKKAAKTPKPQPNGKTAADKPPAKSSKHKVEGPQADQEASGQKPRASLRSTPEPDQPEPVEQRHERDGHAEVPVEPEPENTHETRRPMSAIRQRIAQRLLESHQNTATLTTVNEADVSAMQRLRARHQEQFHRQHGVKLGLTAFFVKACVRALQAYPIINARIDQSDIVYHRDCHIGVAVSTDKGLMVPVLHHAERMSFADIEKTIAELSVKARAGKITIPDLENGTFTITNGGIFGSLLSTPILNPPQSAILGLHAIQKRPVVVNDQIAIRPMMYLALSYDHRLIDGHDAVRFLMHVKGSVEDPERMLLEV